MVRYHWQWCQLCRVLFKLECCLTNAAELPGQSITWLPTKACMHAYMAHLFAMLARMKDLNFMTCSMYSIKRTETIGVKYFPSRYVGMVRTVCSCRDKPTGGKMSGTRSGLPCIILYICNEKWLIKIMLMAASSWWRCVNRIRQLNR